MIYKWKICVLGDASVGKTSLVRHFCEGYFREEYLSTIGVSFLKKILEIEYNNKVYKIILQLWDLGGQTIFSNVRKNYIQGANGALILFDLTQKLTLSHVPNWYEDVISIIGKKPILLIGNKMDLHYKDSIIERAKKLSEKLGIELYLTSAKTGYNMNKIFERISQLLIERYEKKNGSNK
ncbi:MAG: Rab family GTPase [Promethearchaeota archaeon]